MTIYVVIGQGEEFDDCWYDTVDACEVFRDRGRAVGRCDELNERGGTCVVREVEVPDED